MVALLLFFDNLNISYIVTNKKGRAKARNLGIKKARGNVLIFTDDDLLLDKNFINKHLLHHDKLEKSIVLGKVFQIYTSNFIKHFHFIKNIPESPKNFSKIFSKLKKDRSREDPYFKIARIPFKHKINNIPWIGFGTNNASLSKKALLKAGLFDESFKGWGLDNIELGYRLYKNHFNFIYEKRACNYHIAHKKDLLCQKKDFERNISHFIKLHPEEIINNFKLFLTGKISIEKFNSIKINKRTKENYYSEYKKMLDIINDKG